MSQENVDLVRAVQPGPDVDLVVLFRDEATWHTLAEAVAPLVHPDFEAAIVPTLGQAWYRGLDGFRDLWRDWLEPWESYRFEIEDMRDRGDDVLVLVRDYARRPEMDTEVRILGAVVWTVVDGKIARVVFYNDRAEALEAGGLRE